MASGVSVASDAMAAIDEMKTRNSSVILFRLNKELTHIIVETNYGKDFPCKDPTGEARLEALKEKLPENEPRYALLDFSYANEDGHSRDCVVFIAWSPDNSATKLKMLYAASKHYIVKASGVGKVVQASDLGELDYQEVRRKCLKA